MTIQSIQLSYSLSKLYRRYALFLGVCTLVAAGGYFGLQYLWDNALAARWAAQSAAVLIYLLLVFWRGLPLNHRPGEDALLSTLGAGNVTSLFRGILLACLAGFLFSPRPGGLLAWIPGLLYLVAILADFLDGYLARRANHATLLGERLDLSFDSLGVFSAGFLVVQYGQAPAWYLAVPLARYLFLAGEWLLRRLNRPVIPLPPSMARRGFAGLQMGFTAALLLPVFSPPGTAVAAALFAAPFLAGFLRDWLIASGALALKDAASAHDSKLSLTQVIPLGLRLGVIVLLANQALEHLSAGYSQPALVPLGALETAVLVLMMAGAAGRAAAIIGLVLLGYAQTLADLTLAQYVLAGLYTAILYLGTGKLSLWKPEDRLIFTHLGKAAE